MKMIPFTKKGYEDVKIRLARVLEKRLEAVNTLSRAREMGDLSENGLYKAARFELANIDRQIRILKNLVHYGRPALPENNDYVQLGHKVTVFSENADKTYTIVGEYESNPGENKISVQSPLGKRLLGKKTGERIKLETLNGNKEYTVKNISL